MIERYLPPALWVFFVGDAIYGGLTVPHQKLGVAGNGGPDAFERAYPLLLLFFGLGVFVSFVLQRRFPEQAALNQAIGRLFPDGLLERLRARIRPELLGATFFTLLGVIASVGCVLNDSPAINRFFAFMSLSIGFGIVVGLLFQRLLNRRRSA